MGGDTAVLVFDFGASSGRAMLCRLCGNKIVLEELHRFENCPVEQSGALRWDLDTLFREVKTGLKKGRDAGGFSSVGVDTWGVDFGLLDSEGNLLEQPVHYRDSRTKGMSGQLSEKCGALALYAQSGIPCMDMNTLSQLLAAKRDSPELLNKAAALLMMPDLFAYLLTGEKHAERTIASTTQMLDPHTGEWNSTLLKMLDLPCSILPPLVEPGTPAGKLSPALCRELGLESVPVTAVASHDTESALLAVPAEGNFVFLSCGTWSLFGTELEAPCLSQQALACGLANESAYGGKTAFLKNIAGLWLIQESRRQFQREGRKYSFAEMESLARESRPFSCLIHSDAPELIPPGDMPGRIRALCRAEGQPEPLSDGAVLRCIYESLAMTYRTALLEIQQCTEKFYPVIHLVGGGGKDRFLCQMTADACGLPVVAGPVEATALGNAAAQFLALGLLENPIQARKVIRGASEPLVFWPEGTAQWAALDGKYRKFANK